MKNRLNGNVHDFSVDYDAIAVDDIKDIHKYLMKKNNMYVTYVSKKRRIKMFIFTKKVFYIRSLFLSSLVSTTSLS